MAKKALQQAAKSAGAARPEIQRRADRALRQHLLDVLRGGNAHLNLEEGLTGLPPHLRGERPSGLPYSPWRLLEHMRIAQWDILEFSRNPKHVSPEFPAGYWPESDAPPDDKAWQKSIRQFRADLKAMQDLVEDPTVDLFAPIPHGDGQTLLREVLLVADHNSYHLGQIVVLRRLLGVWES